MRFSRASRGGKRSTTIRAIWHFRFNGPTPEALVRRTGADLLRALLERLGGRQNTLAFPRPIVRRTPPRYARPGRMRAAWAYFVSFQQAARDFTRLAQTKLTMPVLSIGGEKANGDALGTAGAARRHECPIGDAAEHRPLDHGGKPAGDDGRARMHSSTSAPCDHVAPRAFRRLHGRPDPQLPQMRLTPARGSREPDRLRNKSAAPCLAGVSTKVLSGDPSKAGFYTIILSVPANTTIPAHSHRDDRMATVVSGTWQFGYGDRFDEGALKTPARREASTPSLAARITLLELDAEPVLVQITGIRTDRHALRQSI